MMEQTESRSSTSFGLPFDFYTRRLFVITLVIFIAFSLLLPGKFFTVRNMQSMAVQLPEFGILAFAIMITMLTGGIDLSIVGTANLAAIVAATIVTGLIGNDGAGMSLWVVLPLALLGALLVGTVCGLFNGLCSIIKKPSIINIFPYYVSTPIQSECPAIGISRMIKTPSYTCYNIASI